MADLHKVIDGLWHHSGKTEWGCWKCDDEQLPIEFCPYYDNIDNINNCSSELMLDAIDLLKNKVIPFDWFYEQISKHPESLEARIYDLVLKNYLENRREENERKGECDDRVRIQ